MSMKKKSILGTSFLVIMFLVIAVIMLFPIYYLALGSLQETSEIFRTGMKLMYDPETMNFNNFKLLVQHNGGVYIEWFKNSILLAILFTGFSLFFSSMVGYGLAVYDFKFKNTIFMLVLVVMMIPLEILMLPLYKLCVKLNILNTYAGVVLPFVVSPVAIFFFRQFAAGFSKEFQEAARIDGCTEIGIYFRIMVPLLKPAFGAMTILLAMQSWNSFVWPLIVLRSNEMLTLTVGLSSLISPYGTDMDILLPGAIVAIIPILVLFLFNQRFFISGLTSGGVKG